MRLPSTVFRYCTLALLPATFAAGSASAQASGEVEIRWSKYGVPHVKAADYESLGFGYGYALARDRLCELTGRALTFRGERSRWYGPDEKITVGFLTSTNLTSDLVYRTQLPEERVQAAVDALQPRTKTYLRGFVAGINHYAATTPEAERNKLCNTAKTPVFRETDIARSLMSLGVIYRGIEVAPHTQASSAAWKDAGTTLSSDLSHVDPISVDAGFGSNAWAYGGDVVKSDGAMMFASPHSSWQQRENQLRLLLHQVQLTIPGELDIAGASFWSFPLPLVGYNKDVAWTILDAMQSVTPQVRQKMKIDTSGARPTYLMDGVPRPLDIRQIPIEIRAADGSVSTKNFPFAFTELGPIYKLPEGPGRPEGWYAFTDSNQEGARGLDQFLHVAHARNAGEFVSAVENNRGIASHLMAADRHGEVAFVESVRVLAATDEELKACHLGTDAAAFNTLDGSKRACSFRDAEGKPLLTPNAEYPTIKTRGIINNTNNSYKYTEFGVVQKNHKRLFGHPEVPEYNIRLIMSARRLKEISADGVVTPEEAKDLVFDDRNFAAEEWLTDILKLCEGAADADVKTGCDILAKWDRTNNADSRGALLFHQFWAHAARIPSVMLTTNPTDLQLKRPLGITPKTAPAIVEAIGAAVRDLREFGFTPDARWGEALFATTANGPIPLHGGSYAEGIMNGEHPAPLAKGGFPSILFGTAYAQMVRWEKGKLLADVLLTHGQTAAESEGRTAQLKLFADKQLYRKPFTPEDLEKEGFVETLVLRPQLSK